MSTSNGTSILQGVKAVALEGFVRALAALRADAWYNPFTGFGSTGDSTMHSRYLAQAPLDPMELSALYHGDDMAQKVVDKLPRAMTRLHFTVTTATLEGGLALNEALDKLHTRSALRRTITWGRLFGGCVLYPGAVDGQPEWKPLEPDLVGKLGETLEIFDARYVIPHEQSYDPGRGPETYTIRRVNGRGPDRVVHRSRLIVARGAETADEERLGLQSWDFSVLQTAIEPLRQFNTTHKSGEIMMTAASEAVMKIKGFHDAITEGDTTAIQTRASLMNLNRSVSKTIMLDADGEDYTKQATSFSGVPEMIDRYQKRLAAAAGCPVTILMGQAPAGLNATGDADVRLWYDQIQEAQQQILKPMILQLARMVAAAERLEEPTGVDFESLWQETPREQAERSELQSRSDQIYITQRVRTNADVALERFGERIPVQAPPVSPAPTASSALPQMPTGTSAPKPAPAEAPAPPPAAP